MQKLLTIVVPVYKVEPYINKCLDSCILDDEKLMNQLEVIIVNDGTPDNSAEMSREYVKHYPNTFRQIDKENGGHGSAWNVGLKEATGKYIRFLDSDDWLTNLDAFLIKLQDADEDLIFTHRADFYLDINESIPRLNNGPFGEKRNVCDLNPFDLADHIGMTNFWLTTYKRTLFKGESKLFLEHTHYDDSILFTFPLIEAKTFSVYDMVVYNYLLGRAGQSVDEEQVRKHVDERIAVYKYNYKKTMSMLAGKIVPDAIYHSLTGQATLLLDICSRYTYTNCKKIKNFIPEYVPLAYPEFQKSKLYKRYTKYPLPIYYLIHKVRLILGKSKLYKQLRK